MTAPPAAPPAPPLAAEVGERLLVEAFPFHLLVGPDGRVVRAGSSLLRTCPQLVPGTPVAEHLRVTSPRATAWVLEDGAAPPHGLVIVEAVAGPLVLRGQLLAAQGGVLFVGSPWTTSLQGLGQLGLRLRDFAAADPVADFLMLLQAQESSLADARSLAARLEQAAAEQLRLATRDHVTGLTNRAGFRTALEQAAAAAARTGGSTGVVMLDLDRFKDVNDALGHDCGTELLRQVGPRVASVLRGGELVARLGGDEFAVLVGTSRRGAGAVEDCTAVAERVLDAIGDPFVVGGVTLTVEATAGIAVTPEHGPDAHALVQYAEIAMYRAKAEHRPLAVHEPAGDGPGARRLTLLAQLRTAIEADELVLHYQPQVDLSTGVVVGVEALVRWQHPEEGLLPPSEFVPLAERSGAVHPLTRRVLALACRQAAAWQRAGRPLVVSVNVSARCLTDATLPDAVAAELAAAGLPAALLTIEITESAIIADPVRARAVLQRLQDLGVRVSVDDFGTGYTCLAHLRDLPVQELKIDRSFVKDMLSAPRNAVLVRTTIELAARLGLTSVAEGIEDADTLAALAVLGCTTGQGYHLARPMPTERLAAWLAERERQALAPAG